MNAQQTARVARPPENGSAGSEKDLPRGSGRLVSCRQAYEMLWNGRCGRGRAGSQFGLEVVTQGSCAPSCVTDYMQKRKGEIVEDYPTLDL